MKYVAGCRCNKTDDKPKLETFYIFAYFYVGWGWCWKEFFDQCIDRMFKKSIEVCWTDSRRITVHCNYSINGKLASHIVGATLHSPFKLQMNKNNQTRRKFEAPTSKTLQDIRNRYQILEIYVLDEISMTGGRTFNDYINLSLQLIERNNLQFGGISIIAIVDFLQLPSVMDRSALQL